MSANGLLNLHVLCHHGKNAHHIVEAIFKACARALRQAVEWSVAAVRSPGTRMRALTNSDREAVTVHDHLDRARILTS